MKAHYNYPVQATINSISGKWKVQIVWHLSFGTLGFSKLRNTLAGISEKVLTEQLRDLEMDGIVHRQVTPSVPPRVDYSLTPAGQDLIPTMRLLCDWGARQFDIKPTLTHSREA